jgi:Zn-finger nucleic acid-binding protein
MTEPLQAPLQCPRCDVPLFEGTRGIFTLQGCGQCGGIWLDNDASRRIVQRYEPSAAHLADLAAKNASTIGVPDTSAKCPVCSELLRRVSAPPTRIQLDVCTAHGTWFDRRELQMVMQALHAPLAPPQPLFAEEARPVVVQHVAAAPAPTAREIAAELYREQQRQENYRKTFSAVLDLLIKN